MLCVHSRLGNLRPPRRSAPPLTQKSEVRSQKSEVSASAARPFQLLSQPGNLNSLPITNVLTAQAARNTNRFALRLSNTTSRSASCSAATAPCCSRTRCSTRPARAAIPDHLRAQGDPGSYMVQARGPIDNAFRSLLKPPGRASFPTSQQRVSGACFGGHGAATAGGPADAGGAALRAVLQAQARAAEAGGGAGAVAGRQRPQPAALRRCAAATRAEMQNLGRDRSSAKTQSPFGPVLKVRPAAESLPPWPACPACRRWSGSARAPANDLSRARIGVSTDTLVTTNYLGLDRHQCPGQRQ